VSESTATIFFGLDLSLSQNHSHSPRDYPRGAVVAVVYRQGKFLTIKRSAHVRAPGAVCFAGGGVEPDEEPCDAIVREMREELNVDVTPVGCVFEGKTPSGVVLKFWQVELSANQTMVPNQDEVESFYWQTPNEFRSDPNLLSSAVDFLDAWEAGAIELIETNDEN